MTTSGGFVALLVALLLLSCFLKVFTTLTILRSGLGLWQWEFGIPVLALALALTFYVMEPYASFNDFIELSDQTSITAYQKKVEPFLRINTNTRTYERLKSYRGIKSQGESRSDEAETGIDDFGLLTASFVVTQLQEAFKIGFIILVPFLVVDTVVINLLMVLGVRALNPEVITLPLKILLFFSVDGWTLITEKLLKGYF